jgi:hypothetical protein
MGKSKLGIVRVITDLPPACYKLSTDGRKWKSLCEARQKLANWLALKGNPDGTQIFPGIARMVCVTDWSRSKVFYVLSDLELIGCVINENARTKERGTSLRRFDPTPLLKAHEAIKRGERFCHATVQDSPNPESNIQDLQSKIEIPTVQDMEPQSKIEDLQSNPALDTTVLYDRPIKPTTTTVKKLAAVEWLSRFGHRKLGSFPINKAHREELQVLADRDGLEMFKQVCKHWQKDRSFDGLNYPAGKLLEEYEGHLSVIRAESKERSSSEEVQTAMDRSAKERQTEISSRLAEITRNKELAAVGEPF